MGEKAIALIVGDDRAQAESLRDLLETNGLGTIVAGSGTPAIEAARSTRPDVVVIDAVIPGMSGFELCRLLKDDPKLTSIPVIILTSSGGAGEVLRAIECGADSYIIKPHEAPHLVACVRALLEIRHKTGQRLDQAQKMDAIGRLGGNMAHDFNNMLMVIQGFVDILARELAEDDRKLRYLAQIRNAVDRSTDLTQKLLVFSGRAAPARELQDLNEVLREAIGTLKPSIGETISLVVRCAERSLPVEADRGQLAQAIVNLAANALDAMPQGGRLEVLTRAEPATDESPRGSAVLTVRDTGCGMTKEVQDRLFEPFFSTKDRGKGTGFGLSAVYGIVNGSSGSVSYESEPGHGTAFTIRLPLAVPAANAPRNR